MHERKGKRRGERNESTDLERRLCQVREKVGTRSLSRSHTSRSLDLNEVFSPIKRKGKRRKTSYESDGEE